MGLIEAHDGNYDKALEIFTRVRQIVPDNFDMILQIGMLQRTPRGRAVTARAYQHLGLEPAAQPGSLFEGSD